MKKIALFSTAFILGALATVLFASTVLNENDSEQLGAGANLYDEEPLQMHATAYAAPIPVDGPDFTTAAEKTIHAVVHIRSQFLRKSNVYDDFFGALREYFGYDTRPNREYPISGFGSGVILSADGYIVTNNHVVQGAELVEVTLNDKRTMVAEIIGTDPSTDLALIKVEAADLPFVEYGNSDNVRIGEWVLAVGNPFNLTSTVTAGIVSAKARNINILGSQSSIESFIQFDAAVNRGNSGGALVNTEGRLVGVNAAIASNTGSFAGYSFAIPVNIVKKVVEDLQFYGEVQRAYVGVIIREINDEFASEEGLDNLKGVYVEALSENGGAQQAGLEQGDVITHLNGVEVNSLSQLLEVVGQYRPGDMVSVDVKRDNNYRNFSVELKNADGTTSIVKKEEKFYNEMLGATLEKIGDQDKRMLMVRGGLRVSSVEGDGLLQRGGIRKGFIITSINNNNVNSRDGLTRALEQNNEFARIQGIYPNGMRVTYELGL
jgi:Do/DeqQ family serine protease